MDGSAKRIYKAALGTPEDHFLILLAHNGPKGAMEKQYLKFIICFCGITLLNHR